MAVAAMQVVEPPRTGTAGFRRSKHTTHDPKSKTENYSKTEACTQNAADLCADPKSKSLHGAQRGTEVEAAHEAADRESISLNPDLVHFCGSPLQLLKRSQLCKGRTNRKVPYRTRRRATSACVLHAPSAITQKDLDKALAELGSMSPWEPENYSLVKVLAPAAAGEGIVVVMSSREQLGEMVAVKSLPFHLIQSNAEEFKKLNPDEAEQPWTDIAIVQHLNKLQYPHVCELLDVCLGDGEVNVVTSLATEGDLFSWLENNPNKAGLARETAVRPMVPQMLKAVRWLHDIGIAHRDLSMENLVLTTDWNDQLQVKIIDFGMATLCRTAQDEVRGKRGYQAPEMFESHEYDAFLVDSFALGIILFFLGAHQYPWNDTNPSREKDRHFEFARAHGLEKFMEKRKMPCGEQRVAEVFTQPFLELICGLLNFDPEMRHSLGEACFHSVIVEKVESRTRRLSMEEVLSGYSTACSSLDSSSFCQDEDEHGEIKCVDEEKNCNRNQDHSKKQQFEPRFSVWDCKWLTV